MPYHVNISISHSTFTSMPLSGCDYKSKTCLPHVHICTESAKHPANTSLTVTPRAPDKMSHISWMKLQGQSPREGKVLLIRGHCCQTGTVSSVSTRSPFRFPLVKYTSLPSLEVGFLKYTPMKTEEPGEWRMGTFLVWESCRVNLKQHLECSSDKGGFHMARSREVCFRDEGHVDM